MDFYFNLVNEAFGVVNGIVASLIFFDILPGEQSLPLAVAWLVAGATFFTFKLGFINIRGFRHAVEIVRGKFDSEKSQGEVTHFQALTTALSATVGLGNIAGVAIAISLGGPGAAFWLIVAGFLGMTSKFVECTLGVMYREIRPDGKVLGGPMEYLSRGLAEKGLPRAGKILAAVFCVMCIGGSFGGGNAFQVNQSLNAIKNSIPLLGSEPWIYGLFMSTMAGLVIFGGLKRIAKTTETLVPVMCGIYLIAGLFILSSHISEIPHMLVMIFLEAFTPSAAYGGALGVLIIGFKRAAFSNEAGVGSAAIAHSAARTNIPVREGFVALLEPFIDTVVVCTITSLVIIITGVYNSPATAELVQSNQGAALTAAAFGEKISWFPHVLSLTVVLFAYSTIISWFYYGERCWVYLFGERYSKIFPCIYIVFTFFGSITAASHILDFSDLMILSMAFPNMLGMYLLFGKVREALAKYKWQKAKE